MEPGTVAQEEVQQLPNRLRDPNTLIQCRVRMRQEAKTPRGASAYRLHFVPSERPQRLCEAGLQTPRLQCGQVAVGRRDNVLISHDLGLVSMQQFTHQILKQHETSGRYRLYAALRCAWSARKLVTIEDCDNLWYRRHEGHSQTLEVCNAFMRFMLLRSLQQPHTQRLRTSCGSTWAIVATRRLMCWRGQMFCLAIPAGCLRARCVSFSVRAGHVRPRGFRRKTERFRSCTKKRPQNGRGSTMEKGEFD